MEPQQKGQLSTSVRPLLLQLMPELAMPWMSGSGVFRTHRQPSCPVVIVRQSVAFNSTGPSRAAGPDSLIRVV